MIKQIPIEPYPKKLYLIWEEMDSSVMHFFHSQEDDYKAIYKLPITDDALTIRTARGNVCIRFGSKPTDPGSIAHEAFHATFAILDYIGMTLTDSSEEAFAYLDDYIVRKIHQEL
jgi:hypothetical protein